MSCPDVFELANGDFAVIGTDGSTNATLLASLPPNAGIASNETIVIVSRETLLHARRDIPEH